MAETIDPNRIIGGIAIAGLVLAGFWQLLSWIRNAPAKPEPWGAEIEESLQQAEAKPICHRCLTPHQVDSRFCGKCNAAVGHYNNWMPYVYIFSVGEVLRNGTTDRLRINPLTIAGYLLCSFVQYALFAPVYWFFLFKNLKRIKVEQRNHSPDNIG